MTSGDVPGSASPTDAGPASATGPSATGPAGTAHAGTPAAWVPQPPPAAWVPQPPPAAWVPQSRPVTGLPYPGTGIPHQYSGVPYPVPGHPGYPPPGWPPLPGPPPAPSRRRGGAARWVIGLLAVALVCSALGLAGLVSYAGYTGAFDPQATWRAPETPVDAPPDQNAPASEWSTWARRSVDESLDAQAAALLAGDEAGYLASVDPGNSGLVAEHKRRFKVLSAMGPGVWRQAVTGGLRSDGTRAWKARIKISYCFGEPDCRAVEISVPAQWRFKNDRLVLVKLEQSAAAAPGPRPWEVDDLTVATGKRVVIAATKVNAWRLKEAVTFADRAAAVADTFAKWQDPPSRYVIFLAGPNDWNTWYGREQPDWAAAWAVPVSTTVTEVVVRTEVVRQAELQQLLTHELIHVTSLAGERDGATRSAWWLIEGIAEYGSLAKEPAREYDALVPTRSFVRGSWNGDPAVDPPTSSASLKEAAGRYGVGYYAVRRLAEKYGKDKMLDFFGRVVHDNEPVETAAPGALGGSWSQVKSDCARYIRSVVG